MLSKLYIFLTKNFTNMFLIPLLIRVFQKFHYNYHGDCRILANGTWIWHLECHYHLTSILGRRSWPDYPRPSLRMCLHHLLLDTHQPCTTSTIWRCFIWMFCHCIKCSIYPAVIISRWGYKSGSNTADLPTPLWKTPHIHHVSSMEHASFDPAHTTPHSTATITTIVHHEALPYQCAATYHLPLTVQKVTRIQTAHQNTQMKKKISKQYL